jgi:hypothetical protein
MAEKKSYKATADFEFRGKEYKAAGTFVKPADMEVNEETTKLQRMQGGQDKKQVTAFDYQHTYDYQVKEFLPSGETRVGPHVADRTVILPVI